MFAAAGIGFDVPVASHPGTGQPRQTRPPVRTRRTGRSRRQIGGPLGRAGRTRLAVGEIWLMRHEGLLLSVLFLQAGERDPELQPWPGWSSARCGWPPRRPIRPTCSPSASSPRPGGGTRRRVETTDVLSVRFGDAQMGLLNFYRQYIAMPERFSELATQVLERAEQLQSASPQRSTPRWTPCASGSCRCSIRRGNGKGIFRATWVKPGWARWRSCTWSISPTRIGTSAKNSWRSGDLANATSRAGPEQPEGLLGSHAHGTSRGGRRARPEHGLAGQTRLVQRRAVSVPAVPRRIAGPVWRSS